MIDETRRTFALRCWPFCIAVATAAALISTVLPSARLSADIAENDSEEDEGEADRLDPERAGWSRLSSAQFDSLAFGDKSDAAAARGRFEKLLEKKVSAAHRICELSEIQRRKLVLAGQGDLKRLFDRIERWRIAGRPRSFEEIDVVRKVVRSDPFVYGSFFDKTLRHDLSFQQLVRYKRWENSNWHAP
jgi:hypothetical protein